MKNTSLRKFTLIFTAFLLGFAAFSVKAVNLVTVTNAGDPAGTGNCAVQNGDCSLRQAISTVSNDGIITFNLPAAACPGGVCTINLTQGTLNITNNLTISGTGARNLIVRRSAAAGTPNFRIFSINTTSPAPAALNIGISNMTISGGNDSVAGSILSLAPALITLTGISVANNAGGIYNQAAMSIQNSSVVNNTTNASGVGGISNGGTMSIQNSLVANNTGDFGGVGGIFNQAGVMTIVNSTVYGNTVPGNTGMSVGVAGIRNGFISPATLNLINVTVSGNRGMSVASSDSVGGVANFTTINVVNTIIAGNTTTNNTHKDVQGIFTSQGNNLIGDPTGSSGFGNAGSNDILNQSPNLMPPANNGGPTDTLALNTGSPAINAGNNCVTNLSCTANNPPSPITGDQRLLPYVRKFGTAVDIGAFESQYLLDPQKPVSDFDGDGLTDFAVFRPSANGIWYIFNNPQTFASYRYFGVGTDIMAPADFTGDGRTDYTVFRPSTGIWYISDENFNETIVPFGLNGDKPIPEDFDGDGKADLAVYRNGVWWWQSSLNNQVTAYQFGLASDIPVQGDFDGDHKADYAVFRPSNGTWYIRKSSDGNFLYISFGLNGDKPAVGDFDGDGKTDISIYRGGVWYILRSNDSSVAITQFGLPTDVPAVGSYDGDGKADIAVFRPSNGNWYILHSSDNSFSGVHFGQTGDKPIPAAYIP